MEHLANEQTQLNTPSPSPLDQLAPSPLKNQKQLKSPASKRVSWPEERPLWHLGVGGAWGGCTSL